MFKRIPVNKKVATKPLAAKTAVSPNVKVPVPKRAKALTPVAETKVVEKMPKPIRTLDIDLGEADSDCGCGHSRKCKDCDKPTVIDSVPYLITEPGKYCVIEDLLFEGTGTTPADAAIVIASSNVEIDFNQHTLVVTSPDVTGISADGVTNVLVKDGALTLTGVVGPASQGEGFFIQNSNKFTIDNFVITAFRRNITLVTSTQVSILGVRSEDPTAAHLIVFNVVGLRVEKVFFTSELTLATAGISMTASEVTFYDSDLINSDIFYQGGTTANFDKVRLEITDPAYIFGAIQLGVGSEDPFLSLGVRDVVIKDSIFVNRSNEAVGPAAMFIVNAHNILVKDSILAMNPEAAPVAEGSQTAGLAIGTSDDPRLVGLIGPGAVGPGTTSVSDVRVESNIITGPSTYGVVIATFDGITPLNGRVTLYNNTISEATSYLVFLENAISVSVKENSISNSANVGILVDGNSTQNVIRENDITDVLNQGILLTEATTSNVVTHNVVISGSGIQDLGSNLVVDNIVTNI